jgi:drug/metabolite transporter (DMT)-like permease
MPAVALGAGAACAASCLYNAGVALQALDAREAPGELSLRVSLIARLVRRPRWLAGTALGVLGWPLQVVALLAAPLAVVQPALAFGLILLLVLGARSLGERVGVRELLAVFGIAAGVALLAALGPKPSSHHAASLGLWIGFGGIGALAIVPFAVRRRRTVGGGAAALAAGLAFAWSGLSTKFAADAWHADAWLVALTWAAATGAASGLALIAEMTALGRRPATQVAPLVFAVQVAVPVVAAPLLTGERWSHTPLGVPGVLAGIGLVMAAALALLSSPAVRRIVDDPAMS